MSNRKSENIHGTSTAWILAWVCLGTCLSAKESVRFTALWHFDVKPFSLVCAIGIVYAAVFVVILFISKKHDIALYQNTTLIVLLTFTQTAGTTVHAFASFGIPFSQSALFLSCLGMESSLLLLLIASQYLYSFGKERAQTGFVYGIFIAGSTWILLVFLDIAVARALACSLCLVSSIALRCSIAQRKREEENPPAKTLPHRPDNHYCEKGHDAPGKFDGSGEFARSIASIFLISLVIMGVYSQWQGQQDNGLASALIQICSDLGLIAAGAFSMIARKFLKASSLFFICQTIVLPVALGALYLGTIFEGPTISISVLLFDLAWGLILFSVWLAPYAYASVPTLFVLAAGFFSHKMGWAVGLAFTRAFPWPELRWIGTLVVVAAFLALIAISGISIAKRLHNTDEALSAAPVYGYEKACEVVGARYNLTKRENEVLLLLAKGRTAPYLARDLFISESTARTHIAHIYRKMNVNSQQELLDEIEKEHAEQPRIKTDQTPIKDKL